MGWRTELDGVCLYAVQAQSGSIKRNGCMSTVKVFTMKRRRSKKTSMAEGFENVEHDV